MKKLAALSVLLLAGCATLGDPYNQQSGFISANYKATDNLIASARAPIDKREPLIVATLVDVNELTKSSRLGRTISDQVASRLTQLGYPVVEVKLRGNIFVKRSEGELLLSREIGEISTNHRAQGVVVGTYSSGKEWVYVNLRFIQSGSNQIVAATDYVLPATMRDNE